MTTLEVGQKLVELCQQNKNLEAVDTLYSPDIVSVEAASMPGAPGETKGIEAVRAKNASWLDDNTIHSSSCDGPYPNGDRFIVHFDYDITSKSRQHRMQIKEMALYTVADGKISREDFFYSMG